MGCAERGSEPSNNRCSRLDPKKRAGKFLVFLTIVISASLFSALSLWGCGSEAVPDYRGRVTEILSALHETHGDGHTGEEGSSTAHDLEEGRQADDHPQGSAGDLNKVIAELEEVRVPAGWEEFHRALLKALSSMLGGSHGETHTGVGHDDESAGQGEGSESAALTEPGAHEKETHTGTEEGDRDHPSSSCGH